MASQALKYWWGSRGVLFFSWFFIAYLGDLRKRPLLVNLKYWGGSSLTGLTVSDAPVSTRNFSMNNFNFNLLQCVLLYSMKRWYWLEFSIVIPMKSEPEKRIFAMSACHSCAKSFFPWHDTELYLLIDVVIQKIAVFP